ncbi:MAG: NERD domain-containing protein [Dehalococcoidia bacterium]|nr:NERD domain-containing protein [Dehalococcoidia bacterium]
MARMIPAVVPEQGVSVGERMLHPVLRDGLDETHTIFHSFKAVSPNLEGKLVDTEIDFLVFSPADGFLVLEVKGGTVVFDGTRGRWYQGDRPIHDPFDQATTNKHKLRSFLAERVGGATPLTLGHAVCFPSTFDEPKNLPPNVARDILITGRDLEAVSDAVRRAYDAFKRPHRTLTVKEIERLRWALMPLCEYGMSLKDRLGQAEQQLFALTEEQCRMLDFIRNQRTALIQGCAGSGKTVMAVKKAHELAAEGHRVLLLAFNQMIGERLKDAVAGIPNIVAGTYHDFCIERLTQAGRLPAGIHDGDFYNTTLPEAFVELVSENDERFDALIVDEGQDFRTDYWVSLSYLLRKDGYFYIFYDPEQNVFGSEMDFPLDCSPFVLAQNCRNSQRICEFVAVHTEGEISPMDRMPMGDPIEESINTSPVGRRRRLATILNQLVNEQGLSASRIVILGGHNIDKTCIPGDGRLGNFAVLEGGEPGHNTIPYYTYMKFKGCEADAVILMDVDPNDPRWSDRAIYTTASRAKHLLYVIRSG